MSSSQGLMSVGTVWKGSCKEQQLGFAAGISVRRSEQKLGAGGAAAGGRCRSDVIVVQQQQVGGVRAFFGGGGGGKAKPAAKGCSKCKGQGAVECQGCKGSGKNKKNGNMFERWKCYDCQGFGLVGCPSCGKGGLTPEQRGER